tara:strand:+ start:10869 stop:11318 length:450 start_codon:yes stop_codon:yes gene_type:complete
MKTLSVILMILFISACSSTPQPEAGEKINLVELENRAEAAYLAGHLDMAEGLYRTLLKSKDNYSQAWFRLGNIYTRTNRLDAAISAYQRCIQLDAEFDKAWYNLAIARMRQATDVLIDSQKYLQKETKTKDQIDELFIQLMRLQTGKKD